MFRRRPLARAAIVGGTAYAAGRHASNRQQAEAEQNQRLEELEQQQYAAPQQYAPPPPTPAAAPPPPAAASGGDPIEALERLGKLRDQGVLTDAEFEVQKEKILQGM
jgi:hypothetical protein